jgi:hypothetical protein
MSEISRADTRRHQPVQPDIYWQESFFMGWYDARSRCGGHHHISLCPYLGLAHVWSWISIAGKVVARSQEPALPLPSDDLDDITLGVLHFTAGETIRDLKLIVSDAATLELTYRGHTDPVTLNFNSGALRLGNHHYESMGRVTGKIVHEDRDIPIAGSAWHDHSWGPRKLNSHRSGRYFWAAFGTDLAFSIYGIDDANTKNRFGYVLDNGVIHPVADATFGAAVADDGVSPQSCDASIWTQTGRGYHVTGRADSHALVGGSGWADGGYFFGMNGLMRYECGGRLGEGLFELTELRSPTEAQRAELRLSPDETK